LYAIANAEASARIDTGTEEMVKVYVGHPHAQTDRYLEVIAELRQPRTLVVFHVMELSDLYRDLLWSDERKGQ
jgi:hypothetical protein